MFIVKSSERLRVIMLIAMTVFMIFLGFLSPTTASAQTCVAGWSAEELAYDGWINSGVPWCDSTSYGRCDVATVTGSNEPSQKGSVIYCCRGFGVWGYIRSCDGGGNPTVPPPAPTVSFTVNGVTNITAPVGTNFTYAWSSTLGTAWSAEWSQTSATCAFAATPQGSSGPWNDLYNPANGTPANGGNVFPAMEVQVGCTYTITYLVSGEGGSQKTATIYVNIVPAIPTGLSVTPSVFPSACGNNWLNISWNKSVGAISYQVYRDGGAFPIYNGEGGFDPTSGAFSDFPLALGSTHWYTVTATNAVGTSPASAPVWGTVAPACALPAPTVTATVNGLVTENIASYAPFTLLMTSGGSASCVYSRTTDGATGPSDWTNLPIPIPNGSLPLGTNGGPLQYDKNNNYVGWEGPHTWRWTFTCDNGFGLITTKTATLIVAAPPALLVSSCSGAPSPVFVGQAVTWSAVVSGGSGFYTYVWSGDAPLAGVTNPISASYPSIGVKNGSVLVTSGSQTAGCGSSVSVVNAVPQITVVPSLQQDYGSVGIGASKSLTFNVTNTGNVGSLLFGGVTIGGVDAARFTCTANCNYANLGVGDAPWPVTVRFTPGTVGAKSASANFTGGGGKSVPLIGTGNIDIICTSCGGGGGLDFGNVPVGRTKDLVLSIINSGTTAYGMDSLKFTPATSFTCVGGCTVNLAPGIQNNISVRFSPTLEQPYAGNVGPTTYPSVLFTLQGVGVTGIFKFEER